MTVHASPRNDQTIRRLAIMQTPEMGLTGEWLGPIERAFLAAGVQGVAGAGPALHIVGKALNRAGLFRHVANLVGDAAIVQLARLTAYRAFPRAIWQEIIPDCFDCWEPDYSRWIDLLRRLSPRVAFFSARQSAAHMERHVPGLRAIWAPEAVDPAAFAPDRPLRDRTIDVLELGRRHAPFHAAITEHRVGQLLVHRFERAPGAIIFATRTDLVAGLADTKVSVCFPSSLTHPERSGNVETLTQRYLESIASGCVLLGRCPAELADLFGFDPVVAVDEGDPAGQLAHIIAHIDDHTALTYRARARLYEVATLAVRTERMLSQLEAHGYRR